MLEVEAERTDELSECRVALLRRMALSSLLHCGRAPRTGVARAPEGSLQTFLSLTGRVIHLYKDAYSGHM